MVGEASLTALTLHFPIWGTFFFILLQRRCNWLLGQHFRESLEQERARKRELLESAERLNALNNATFEGINLTLDGVIIEANNQLAEMLGRNGSELIGCPAVDFIAPESRGNCSSGIRELRTRSV